MKKYILSTCFILLAGFILIGCQKFGRPEMSNFPVDANTPGGPLKFYAAFNGSTTDPLMNAVDSIRANFASENPLTSITGINSKGIQGESKKFIKYKKPNDWATTSKSFTVASWYKKNGQTKNNTGTNGPEYLVSFKSSNGHWSGSNFFLMLEGDNAACAVKVEIVDANNTDNWFTWEGSNTIPGLLDNQWHHLAIVYEASNSTMTLYIDGVAKTIKPTWGTHGNINIDDSKISEMRIGCGPGNSFDTDDWLSSSWKGQMDQFRMYGTALTASEVMALFTNKQ